MKKRNGTIAVVAFSMVVIGMSCARTAPPRVLPGLSAGDPGWVARTLKKMTLEEKAGQMVTVRYPGTFVNLDSDSLGELESLVRNRKIGGLILAAGEAYEAAYLLNRLQGAAKVPLLVAADLESAAGTKIAGATLFPPLMAIGAAGPAPVTVVSFGSPYFLRHFPEVGAYLCLYRNTPQTQEIAARVLNGEMETLGKLPVTLPGFFPAGHGLEMHFDSRPLRQF